MLKGLYGLIAWRLWHANGLGEGWISEFDVLVKNYVPTPDAETALSPLPHIGLVIPGVMTSGCRTMLMRS